MQAAIFGRNKKRQRDKVEGLENDDSDDWERRKRERIEEREAALLNSQEQNEMEEHLLRGGE